MTIQSQLQRILDEGVENHTYPGASAAYLCKGERVIVNSGRLSTEGDAPVVTENTLYDVASVTKSIPTNTLALALIEQGKLHLDDLVITYLPELQTTYCDQITIRHLLTYTVSLNIPRGLSTYAEEGLDQLKSVLFTAPLRAAPGSEYHYTNAPAIWLGYTIERIMNVSLDQAARTLFFDPLGMVHTTFLPAQSDEIAPNERDWRGVVQGTVHDEAAWAFRQAGLTVGNAGLFSTSKDLLIFMEMLLAQGTWQGRQYFSPAMVEQMYTNQVASLNDWAGLGWELNQPRFMGRAAHPQLFGKTGFTGCLVMADPKAHAALILLSNRTCPVRPASAEPMNSVRRVAAELIFGA